MYRYVSYEGEKELSEYSDIVPHHAYPLRKNYECIPSGFYITIYNKVDGKPFEAFCLKEDCAYIENGEWTFWKTKAEWRKYQRERKKDSFIEIEI